MTTVLVVEDDRAVLRGITESLELEHFEVAQAEDGITALEMAQETRYDIIILDLLLPGKTGEDVCRELRGSGNDTPILILSNKQEEFDKVLGLELGADDYMTKPFGTRELLARIRAILRRGGALTPDLVEYSFGEVWINFKKQEVTRSGEPLKLTAKEFEVMRYFIEHEGEVVSRKQLLDEVWGYETFPTTRTVDNFILSLRKKIEGDPSNPRHITTAHSVGYKFIK
ncbi:MAG: response regulator transcription factor [Candidatus Marinimicrobia bacterium]|nr:response regulator transcription factor [Candidatus Neomarinimicrobiota bacterium]